MTFPLPSRRERKADRQRRSRLALECPDCDHVHVYADACGYLWMRKGRTNICGCHSPAAPISGGGEAGVLGSPAPAPSGSPPVDQGESMPTITREGVSINVPVEADALAHAIRWHEVSNDTETTPEQVVKTAEVFAAFMERQT